MIDERKLNCLYVMYEVKVSSSTEPYSKASPINPGNIIIKSLKSLIKKHINLFKEYKELKKLNNELITK